ncbi:LLM class flavin-dependent oxidoreductase [Actinomadura sp. LOL_016]|uniref:LLM class flavin-dependent oxidoreductase n=1 Tax=unclassified Actinomadura TaxID=2626254 RepID=UPI003A81238F
MPLPRQRTTLKRVSDLDYTDEWTSEASGSDASTPLAVISRWAPELRLGTTIAPVYTRGLGLPAMQTAALADLAPGRFVLGVGASSRIIVEDRNAGVMMTTPLA